MAVPGARIRTALCLGLAVLLIAVVAGGRGAAAGSAPAAAFAAHRCVVPGTGEPLDRIWRPAIGRAIAYARGRTGDLAFAVRTDRRFYGYRPDHVEWSASVVKAMLLVAYLNRPSVAHRALNGYDVSLLAPMITRSDNAAAGAVDGIVGNAGLDGLGRRVGMTHFLAVANPWGETHITASDQTRFFLHIDRFVTRRHRAYAMHLLASITPSQRWGIGQVAPHGWRLYFKGGWGSGTGLLDHQVVLLTRGCARVSLAVLSMYDGSHAYGKATLRAIFSLLLRHFPTGVPLYPFVAGGRYRGYVAGETGGLRFSVSRNGRLVQGFAVDLSADPGDRCTAGRGLFVGSMKPDPRGRFAASGTGPGYRFTVSGRLRRRRRAFGTVTVSDVDATTGRVTCTFAGRWFAHVPASR